MTGALYDQIGIGYTEHRRPDARIAKRIDDAIGGSGSILNVGAGSGAYEPTGRFVLAVEPSAGMIRQRSSAGAGAIQAVADRLPLRDRSVDAVLAILTIHHWSYRDEGLMEMRRVARDRVVIFTWDPEHHGFWLVQDYLPEILGIDRSIFPSLHDIEGTLGPIDVEVVPIPADCSDGFLGAYWRRPAAYLDPGVRAAISTFSKFDPAAGIDRLRREFDDGTWSDRYRSLAGLRELDIGYRLIVARYP